MATSAAASTFVRVFSDPEAEQARGQFEARQTYYRYLWHWYKNSVFDDLATWAAYRNRYRLYRYTRSIYNPARRLVDFYAGIVYPGTLTADGLPADDDSVLAIPLADDVAPELRAALGQLWQWSNWQSGKSLYVRYGAALGDVLVQVVDELDRGKVTLDVVWPGLVADLSLDSTGNVKAYALEYDVLDPGAQRAYIYRQEVDAESIRTFKDGAPFAFDELPAERDNPYTFAPAVWVKHTDLGGDHGDPALRNLGKWDELNSLAAHAFDQAHKILGAPLLVSGEGVAYLRNETAKRGPTHDFTEPERGQEEINLLTSGPGGTIATAELPEGEVQMRMDSLLAEIERDHPELAMYQQLRSMSNVTGPAAERLFGDTLNYVMEARAAYDTQSVKLFQMAVAIAGWRASTGAWGPLNRQQVKFAPFGLDSYAAGDLDFSIQPRPLVPRTPLERLQEERQRIGLEADRAGGSLFGTPAMGAQMIPGQTDQVETPAANASSPASGIAARLSGALA